MFVRRNKLNRDILDRTEWGNNHKVAAIVLLRSKRIQLVVFLELLLFSRSEMVHPAGRTRIPVMYDGDDGPGGR